MDSQLSSPAVGMATDLSLLTPKPETLENSSITTKAGEIADTESAKRARSSAKAKGTKEPRPANLSRRGS